MPEETIVAIATPPGRGGLGVVRLSGPRAYEIATHLIRFPKLPLETQHATVGELVEPESGRALDRVVVTCFRAPHSYTAEDVVEISCHGAPVILSYLVEQCLARGARAAEPGEFTMRAFLNGRIDLTQAEAVRDLIEARTLYQARVAAQQMEGAVSSRLKPHKQVLLELIAKLEAGIDFAEDDVPVSGWDEIVSSIEAIRTDLGKLAEGYSYGRIVREGLSLAIVGRPNVGKSSLFNRLLNEDRAIVTATPGTTRDLVSESASVHGIPLRFVDTAGIREALDEAERIGVQKSLQAIADSDLRLMVVDASEAWKDEDSRLLEKMRPLGSLVVAANKSDLPARMSLSDLADKLNSSGESRSTKIVRTSALSGEGLQELREAILQVAAPGGIPGREADLLTNFRHQQLINDSLQALAKARDAARARVHHEMLLLDLYDALRPLDRITGATDVEDVLGIIFSTFCVGK
ncbi:MAG TPA: tRNA uridine-5-carboxymethylaminomethyl(34) synthesis GTPase MnmE [Terriglobia bacterium]|nr:tRNA uridine-5-carboxymethylaminomethyl(34) synthesis GTPase MnmE [Terriglobia bacterium]